MSGGRSPRHAQNPLSGKRRKTLSITHHALSPHSHIIICTSLHLINWLQRFYRITISLKRPFVPKNDVKQWFTTTTTYSGQTFQPWRKCMIVKADERIKRISSGSGQSGQCFECLLVWSIVSMFGRAGFPKILKINHMITCSYFIIRNAKI